MWIQISIPSNVIKRPMTDVGSTQQELSSCTGALGSYSKDPLEAEPRPSESVHSFCPPLDYELAKGDTLYGYTQ